MVFRFKSLHLLEEACSPGFSGGFEQGKTETAAPLTQKIYTSKYGRG